MISRILGEIQFTRYWIQIQIQPFEEGKVAEPPRQNYNSDRLHNQTRHTAPPILDGDSMISEIRNQSHYRALPGIAYRSHSRYVMYVFVSLSHTHTHTHTHAHTRSRSRFCPCSSSCSRSCACCRSHSSPRSRSTARVSPCTHIYELLHTQQSQNSHKTCSSQSSYWDMVKCLDPGFG